jgi:protein O-mannosyl-transferase
VAAALCGFLLLAVALVFGRTVGHEFVNIDDGPYVYDNPVVLKGLTLEGFRWAFTTGHASNWHPLTWLSHMLDCQFYGLQPGGHHLTSVLLHGATVVVLFLVLWRMTGLLWRSAFVAAVFAVHPLRAESVAWVAERKDVLSGLFFVLTLWAYAGYARRPFSPVRYLTVAALFALGLMAKPMLVTLPFVLLLLDYWPLGRIGPAAGRPFSFPWPVVAEKLPLLALTALSCAATFWAQGGAIATIDAIPISSRIANALVSFVAYIGSFFYPEGLAVFYPLQAGSLPTGKVAASTLTLAGISAAALVWRRRFPYLFVGWFWYVGMLVPVIGLLQVGSQSMADRYTYLPQIGLCLSVTWGGAQLAASGRYRRRACVAVSAAVVLILMGLGWRQTSYWRNSETLWIHTLDCTADNYEAHNSLGNVLTERGQFDAAIPHYQKALEIKPNYAAAHYNLGVVLSERGQNDAAVAHYLKALEIKPNYAEAHNNLGTALAERGQIDAAIAHFQKALEINPDYAGARDNLNLARRLRR